MNPKVIIIGERIEHGILPRTIATIVGETVEWSIPPNQSDADLINIVAMDLETHEEDGNLSANRKAG